MINIRGLIDNNYNDIFYRYKMNKPKIVDQKNNKIFENLDIVLKDINRDPKLFIKFMKSKMGINIICKKNKYILPKNIEVEQIMNCLYEFIDVYVICFLCKLPETILNNNIVVCKCCSHNKLLNDCLL